MLLELTIDLKPLYEEIRYMKLWPLNLAMNIINKSFCLITVGIFDRRLVVVIVKLNCVDLAILILKAANIASAFLLKNCGACNKSFISCC